MATPVGPPPPIDTQAPSAPGALSATGGLSSVDAQLDGLDATTSASSGTTSTAARRPASRRAPPTGSASPPGTGFTRPGLAPGTYYYRVTAEDAAGNVSASSNQATGVVTGDVTPPGSPGTLQATGALGSASLSWSAATDNVGVVRYNVHRSTVAGFVPGRLEPHRTADRHDLHRQRLGRHVLLPGDRRGRRRQRRRPLERGERDRHERHDGSHCRRHSSGRGHDGLRHGDRAGERVRQRRRRRAFSSPSTGGPRSPRHERAVQHLLGHDDRDGGPPHASAPSPATQPATQTTSAGVDRHGRQQRAAAAHRARRRVVFDAGTGTTARRHGQGPHRHDLRRDWSTAARTAAHSRSTASTTGSPSPMRTISI